jgi:hypothetical protein
MKGKLLILLLAVAVSLTGIVSCTSSKGGCKVSQGYVGYGSR